MNIVQRTNYHMNKVFYFWRKIIECLFWYVPRLSHTFYFDLTKVCTCPLSLQRIKNSLICEFLGILPKMLLLKFKLRKERFPVSINIWSIIKITSSRQALVLKYNHSLLSSHSDFSLEINVVWLMMIIHSWPWGTLSLVYSSDWFRGVCLYRCPYEVLQETWWFKNNRTPLNQHCWTVQTAPVSGVDLALRSTLGKCHPPGLSVVDLQVPSVPNWSVSP